MKEISAFPDKAGNKWIRVQHKEILPIITFMKVRGFILMTEDTDEMTVCSADQHCLIVSIFSSI